LIQALLEGCAVLSALLEIVVAGPILWLALREAALSREAPLAVSPPPFRFPSFRRSPSESLVMTRAADHETGAEPVRGRRAGLTEA
jgi:hypothetical protein